MKAKRKTFEERSIIAWMQPGETNEQAMRRLSALWDKGEHPLQLARQRKAEYEKDQTT